MGTILLLLIGMMAKTTKIKLIKKQNYPLTKTVVTKRVHCFFQCCNTSMLLLSAVSHRR